VYLAETEAPVMVVFDETGTITADEIEGNDWPHLHVKRGAIAELCASSMFWRLLAEGPVCVWFEDRLEAHAAIEAYSEARRRRAH
jgi:hypothetical protein